MASGFGFARTRTAPKASPVEDPKRTYRMVILGETGSGKTSLLELLLNYELQYDSKEYDLHHVKTFEKPRKVKEAGKSVTVRSIQHSARFGDISLDIIDTPGFCDTEGECQDKENIANIVAIIREQQYINCVCFVINGTHCRLSFLMKEVLSQLKSILPVEVLKNVIVVYSFIDYTQNQAEKLEMLKKCELVIPAKHLFAINNPLARLNFVMNEANPRLIKRLKEDFEDSHETLKKMFRLIQTFKPVLTLKFGEFQGAVEKIRVCFAKLVAFYKNLERFAQLVSDAGSFEDNVTKLTYVEMVPIETDKKNLICYSEGCFKNCHISCDCWFTFLSPWFCSRIRNSHCTDCSHTSSSHKVINVRYHKVEVELDGKQKKYKALIKQETEELESCIMKFLAIGSNIAFSSNATNQIDHLEKELEQLLPAYEFQSRIADTLTKTKYVIKDPIAAPDDAIKFCWACGVLGLDPNNYNKSEIAKAFRQRADMFHPDATGDESTTKTFQHLEHAYSYLKSKVLKN